MENLSKAESDVLETLEYAYSGAKMKDDYRAQIRLARAMAAFKFSPDEDLPPVEKWSELQIAKDGL